MTDLERLAYERARRLDLGDGITSLVDVKAVKTVPEERKKIIEIKKTLGSISSKKPRTSKASDLIESTLDSIHPLWQHMDRKDYCYIVSRISMLQDRMLPSCIVSARKVVDRKVTFSLSALEKAAIEQTAKKLRTFQTKGIM